MSVLVAIDHHFLRLPNGGVHLGPPMSIPGYDFWKRYLAVFGEVRVLARVKSSSENAPATPRADGSGVSFHELPDYLGPWAYLRNLRRLRRGVERAVDRSDAYILRVPGAVGQLAWKSIRRRGLPFALEVVADPWDNFSPGAVRSIVRPVVRHRWSADLRQMCREASAVCYVTREALQKRYPPGPRTWANYASDVELHGGLAEPCQLDARIRRLRRYFCASASDRNPLRVGFLGALSQMYKAPDVLLRAAAQCRRDGLGFDLTLAGDGKFRRPMENLARGLGIGAEVCFLGALSPGGPVFEFLDRIDLFVLPSRQEGLPRAMVEAMARGCPCIGSSVGGIPELLPPEDLVQPGDAGGLAAKILEVISSPLRMELMSRRNWMRAQEYHPNILAERRGAFYRKVRDEVGNHASGGSRPDE